MIKGKVVVVGVTGGIAAYKSAELVRALVKRGAEVYCVMTASACQFITPLTLRTLSGNPVYTKMFDEPRVWDVEHVGLADKADLIVVAPATANILAKAACGIADDFLSTTILATNSPVLFAPAMNVNMLNNRVTQDNIKRLEGFGHHVMATGHGDLACGYQGEGRLADIEEIMFAIEELLAGDKPLQGYKVLITAGPTQEPLDPVRYLTNHSSGKMGYSLARCAQLMGAEVTLVCGPIDLNVPKGIKRVDVQTAEEMYQAVLTVFTECDVVIKAAAVADYRPKQKNENKIKKQNSDIYLELARNKDILAELGKIKEDRVLVGFAAETEDVVANASEKIKRKNLDFIVANDLLQEGAGFKHDTNTVSLVFPNATVKRLPQMSKDAVAVEIWQNIIKIIKMRGSVG